MQKSALIVDDFRISNEVVSHTLENIGFITYSAQRGTEAISKLREAKVDVIITDYHMPEMDGIQFLKEVRKIPECGDVPIIFLSSSDKPEIIDLARQYNIIAWLKKPLNINELKKILFKLFNP